MRHWYGVDSHIMLKSLVNGKWFRVDLNATGTTATHTKWGKL